MPITLLPPPHADRYALAEEVHARPPEPLDTPSRASCVAVVVSPDDRPRELAHLTALCERFGANVPQPGMTHLSVPLGPLRLKWERHSEFSTYAVFAPGLSPVPFAEPAASLLPTGWLADLPGRTIFAGHAKLMPHPDPQGPLVPPDAAWLARHFEGFVPVGAAVGDGAALAFTDFRVHDDGFSRFVVLDRSLTQRQAGRVLQRLFEIEYYRMMALLALPIARRQSPRIVVIEGSLAALTDAIARDDPAAVTTQDEALLHELTRLAAEVESGLAASQFRFGACRAYAELVSTRIRELREQRLPGIQTIEEFMTRRFSPAVATCTTVSSRLHDLSERVAQASALLSTRVDIARERQNQALLASMDRRAKLQLRLQQTVEGLSVAAIVYYAAGLVSYLAKSGKAAGARIDPDLVVGLSIPLLLGAVVMSLRRARRRLLAADSASSAGH